MLTVSDKHVVILEKPDDAKKNWVYKSTVGSYNTIGESAAAAVAQYYLHKNDPDINVHVVAANTKYKSAKIK